MTVRSAREERGELDLPGGEGHAALAIGRVTEPDSSRAVEYAVLRVATQRPGQPVNDRVCVVHPQWMDLVTARAVGAALFELAAEGTGAE